MTIRCFGLRKLFVTLVLCCSVLTTGLLYSQDLAPVVPSSASDDAAPTVGASSGERDVSLRQLPANFLSDQKDIWLFPLSLARGKHWLPTIGVAAVTAGLLAA